MREKTFPEVYKADLTQFVECRKNENRKDQKHFSCFVSQTVCVLLPSACSVSGVPGSDFMYLIEKVPTLPSRRQDLISYAALRLSKRV